MQGFRTKLQVKEPLLNTHVVGLPHLYCLHDCMHNMTVDVLYDGPQSSYAH